MMGPKKSSVKKAHTECREEFSSKKRRRIQEDGKDTWKIGTWNLHGGYMDPIKAIMVSNDFNSLQMDFVALQEVQSKVERTSNLGVEYYQIILPKGDESGLGFVVAQKHKQRIASFKIFSDRVASITLKVEKKGGEKDLTIINLHAPTLASTRTDPDKTGAFYELLQAAWNFHSHKFEKIILAGDWNAKLGKRIYSKNQGQ